MKVFVVLALAIATVSAGAVPAHEQEHQQLQDMVSPKDSVLPTAFSSIEGRITNGYAAYEGKAPYTVGLGFIGKNGGGWWCGGSIIANTWVLTAAHCTNDASSVTIYFGASWRLQAQYTHWVGSWDFIQHHNWPHHNGNDIALVRIPHVDFWHLVNKVELPSFNDRHNSYADWWAVACGWGKQSDNGGVADYLNCVDVQIMSNAECSRTYSITEGILCINTSGGRSTCSGDSGGPLVTHNGNRLVGVTSFVSGAGCTAGHPSGFTRVTSHLDWIRDNSGVASY